MDKPKSKKEKKPLEPTSERFFTYYKVYKRLNNKQIAHTIGVSEQSVSMWLRGLTTISTENQGLILNKEPELSELWFKRGIGPMLKTSVGCDVVSEPQATYAPSRPPKDNLREEAEALFNKVFVDRQKLIDEVSNLKSEKRELIRRLKQYENQIVANSGAEIEQTRARQNPDENA